MEKYLIVNPFGIGDVLFTTPVIKALKEKYPDCVIGYWCNERVKNLLKNDPNISKVFALSRGDIKRISKNSPLKSFFTMIGLLKEIRKEKFDVVLDFSLDSRYSLLLKIAGIRKRIGFNYKNRGRFLTDRIDLKGYSEKHVVEYYSDLLKFIGIEHKICPLDLMVTEENTAKARDKLAEFGVLPSGLVLGIAMGGGASWGKDAIYKQWPPEKFGQLAGRLIKDLGARVLLLGSADEKPIADIVGKMGQSPLGTVPIFPSKNIIDLTGKLDLEELAAIIKELKLLVCNDGGPLHMAVALGIKTVSIFGPVDDRVYGPYPRGEQHIVIKKDLSCRPCYENFRFQGCFNNRRCLEEITVSEVFEKVKGLLTNSVNIKVLS